MNRDSVRFLDEGWNGDSVGVSKIYEVAESTVMGRIVEYKAKKGSVVSHDRKLWCISIVVPESLRVTLYMV